jgi:hypothetical protein
MRGLLVLLLVPALGCGAGGGGSGANPFLEDQALQGKADTQYLNPDGVEVEVTLEADVQASEWALEKAPAMIGQYGMTYLRKSGEFYLESLAEDATSRTRVEWLVDGQWITAAQAQSVDKAKLTHFRIQGVNAVALHSVASEAIVGKVFKAKVPLKPNDVMSEAGETCGEVGGHIGLSQSTYWYLWEPEKAGCKATMQDMSITVTKLLPHERTVYPEYDQLAADGKITAVILFGLIGDEMSETDTGFRGLNQMASWLKEAKFTEVTPAPVGRRFTRHVGTVDIEIDLYSPKEFSGLSDYSHFNNFQTALSEHEIIAYDGHSMLGASDFWSRPSYPKFYQIILYGGCLGYEYYLTPILKGKGGWDKVDILSSVIEVSAGANEFAGPFLAKLVWAADHGWNVSWKDHLTAIRKRVGDSTFGVSGVRENCFSPAGSYCGGQAANTKRFENKTTAAIPDNDTAGVVSVIDIPDDLTAQSLTLELNVKHDWVGDLRITLEHDGVEAVVWDKAGASDHDIRDSFFLDKFTGVKATGRWTLLIQDTMAPDAGTLESWALVVGFPQ